MDPICSLDVYVKYISNSSIGGKCKCVQWPQTVSQHANCHAKTIILCNL